MLAHLFEISRQAADAYAIESHLRLARAQAEGWLDEEVIPVVAPDGSLYAQDDGVRPDSSVEKLASLRPVTYPRRHRPWVNAVSTR